jgi:hypothetical protein
MSSTMTTAANTTTKSLKDIRGFWRVLLAVLAPIPLLAKAVYYVLIPVDGGASFTDTVAAFQQHRDLVYNLRWLDAVFMLLLLPATIAVALVTRRHAPRLATAGLLLAGLGLLAGFGLIGGPNTPALITVHSGLDVATMSNLYDTVGSDPMVGIAMVLFLIGIVFGLGLLGAALWRSRVAPAWMGMSLMIGGITHPFLPGHVAQGIGLIVGAVGYGGASLALLRISNDDFDLAPARGPVRSIAGSK